MEQWNIAKRCLFKALTGYPPPALRRFAGFRYGVAKRAIVIGACGTSDVNELTPYVVLCTAERRAAGNDRD